MIKTSLILAIFAANLIILWIARGEFTVGWEYVGIVKGKEDVAELGLRQGFLAAYDRTRHFQYWLPVSSLLFSFIPGVIATKLTGILLPQIYALVINLAVFFFYARARQIDVGLWSLIVCSSPALISAFISGYPHLSGAFPYLAALYLVLTYRGFSLRSFIFEACCWAATAEVALHCYELGKTVFIVPAIAAITLSSIPAHRRLLWVGATILILAKVNSVGTFNVDHFSKGMMGAEQLLLAFSELFHGFFSQLTLDFPALIILASFSLVVKKQNRIFWLLLILAQWALLIKCASMHDELRTRRTLLLTFCCAAIVADTYRELSLKSWARKFIVIGLCSGIVFTCVSSVRFLLNPATYRTLPFTDSQADFYLDRTFIQDLDNFKALGHQKIPQFFFYGYDSPSENTTDPAALPERLNIMFSEEEFNKLFYFFSKTKWRYSTVRMFDTDKICELMSAQRDKFLVHIPNNASLMNVSALDKCQLTYRELDPPISHFKSFVVSTPVSDRS